jgi:hypothetical protein
MFFICNKNRILTTRLLDFYEYTHSYSPRNVLYRKIQEMAEHVCKCTKIVVGTSVVSCPCLNKVLRILKNIRNTPFAPLIYIFFVFLHDTLEKRIWHCRVVLLLLYDYPRTTVYPYHIHSLILLKKTIFSPNLSVFIPLFYGFSSANILLRSMLSLL